MSPYKIYQYFINVSDDDAARYLKVFSFKSVEEINKVIEEHYHSLGTRVAQKALAYEVVSLVHGKEKAEECKKMSEALFSGAVSELTKENIEELFGDLRVELPSGLLFEDLLVQSHAAMSKREARDFINGNSVAINGVKCTDIMKVFDKKDALYGQYIVLKRGKKNYYLIDLK